MYDADADSGRLIAFADVVHGSEAVGGCAAAVLIVNNRGEPVEFVFNTSKPGCSRVRLAGLWAAGAATRAEERVLLRSVFDGCATTPSALVVDEGTIDGRMVGLDLRLTVPTAFVRAGVPGVARWLPVRPSAEVALAIDAVGAHVSLGETLTRLRSGLFEACAPAVGP
jgi:hypothetical protein